MLYEGVSARPLADVRERVSSQPMSAASSTSGVPARNSTICFNPQEETSSAGPSGRFTLTGLPLGRRREPL
jgi:hypothetical protein